MPLQHISQNMLKIMKRGKGAEKLKRVNAIYEIKT